MNADTAPAITDADAALPATAHSQASFDWGSRIDYRRRMRFAAGCKKAIQQRTTSTA